MIVGSEPEAKHYVRELCSQAAFDKLEIMVSRLEKANERQNLVSKPSLAVVWQRHIADSAQLLNYVSRETLPLVDLGSGAGFPGLVLAIMRPELPVLLVESRGLRLNWLAEIIELNGIRNCTIEGMDVANVETFAARTITARAFAPLPKILTMSARFSTAATDWVLPKGRSARQEVAELPEALRVMFHVEPSVTDRDAGIVVGKGKMEPPK